MFSVLSCQVLTTEGSGTVRTACMNMQKQSESTNCNELDTVRNVLVATVKKITVAPTDNSVGYILRRNRLPSLYLS